MREVKEVFWKYFTVENSIQFVYFPDGTIQLKENICSCDKCLKGDLRFEICKLESGKVIFRDDSGSESEESKSEDKGEESDENGVNFELVGDTIFEAVKVWNVAVYSSYNSFLSVWGKRKMSSHQKWNESIKPCNF